MRYMCGVEYYEYILWHIIIIIIVITEGLSVLPQAICIISIGLR